MELKNSKVLKSLNPRKILIPVLIGVIVVVLLLFSGDDINYEQVISSLKNANIFWVIAAFAVLLFRDLGYMYRIRHLTKKGLSWLSSFFVIFLWEFASAVTPSVVGGTAIAVFILNKEGISFGKSLSYVILTAAFDNLFFVIASVLVLIFVPFEIFPNLENFTSAGFNFPLKTAFAISVSLIAVYTFLMIYGLFIKPKGFKWLLVKFTSNRILKRFRNTALQSGDDMIIASEMIKGENWKYWLKASISTVFIWSARYLMVNCLIAAFTGINLIDHLIIFSRQIIMWIVMLISPTPGSAGAAEVTFRLFFGEFFQVAGLVLAVAIFWRIFTYYAYLLAGVLVLPRWMRRTFLKK